MDETASYLEIVGISDKSPESAEVYGMKTSLYIM